MEYPFESVNKLLERTIRNNWDRSALSNYGGVTLSFGETARYVEQYHFLFRSCGIVPGDRIALCGKNHVGWAVGFLAALTYGAVPVPLLHEFKPASVHNLVDHSECRFLFVDEQIWKTLDFNQMPSLYVAMCIGSLSVLDSRCGALPQGSALQDLCKDALPDGWGKNSIDWYEDKADELALINYTSGTSGFSKGVMLTYLNVWSNLDFALKVHSQMGPGSNIVSILPSAHMYGLMFEFLYQFSRGVHIHFLTRIPSPKILLEAMSEIRPNLIIAVPLVIEKIYKNVIEPEISSAKIVKLRKNLPLFDAVMMQKIRWQLVGSLGGKFDEIIIGGAAFNRDVEQFFHKMYFPFTVGYGMTECGPIITYARWNKARVGSSGKAAPHMELRIDSEDPRRIPGEILCRGANVFKGYYKNEEQTRLAFTPDGWFRTGDMGIIDKDGYLFIKGRCKCMILGPSGQNIYPEELESAINALPYVVESLVVDRGGVLTALVYPDRPRAAREGMSEEDLCALVRQKVAAANEQFANYCRIKTVEILKDDFERTPKKSIKRFLYQEK